MQTAMQNESMDKTYLVTGAAGFIGYYLAKRLLMAGCRVVGIDNLNDYYDVRLKEARLELLKPFEQFHFIQGDLADKAMVEDVFAAYRPEVVVHLAAQAGVRYSLENPDVYIQSNIVGFFNILEACRHHPVDHLVYASSSSVYGANTKVPFAETDPVDHPVSLYAATKKSNELMAHTYSHLYGIPATGLRFFTVYGPMGRPDMAYFSFVRDYFAGQAIHIFNNGDFAHDLYRDFTYIDDIVEGVVRLLPLAPGVGKESETGMGIGVEVVTGIGVEVMTGIGAGAEAGERQRFDSRGAARHRIYNIGNNRPEKLMTFITTLERCLGKSLGRAVEFKKIFEPIKPGDVPATYADTTLLQEAIGFKPSTSIEEGLQRFTDWYVAYYNK